MPTDRPRPPSNRPPSKRTPSNRSPSNGSPSNRSDDAPRKNRKPQPRGTPRGPRIVHKQAKPGEPQRIAKILARAGVGSRRDVERMIADGRIAIHGEVLDTPATLVTDLAGITVDGERVGAIEPPRLFLFHKPSGVLTAARDPGGRPTIYDRLPPKGWDPADKLPRLMPVGRLDLNTEGLLLLTNDGELKRHLELPANGVERSYRARAFGTVSQQQLEGLMMGITIDGVNYGRINANLERRTGRNQWVEMTLTEGKNREVRKVLEHFELKVSRLIRTRYGPFTLGDAPPGALTEVPPHDLERFIGSLTKKAKAETKTPKP